ncbi:MAG: hypothetical protein ACRDZO_09370 [Egibacteraceae bacterium]
MQLLPETDPVTASSTEIGLRHRRRVRVNVGVNVFVCGLSCAVTCVGTQANIQF